MAPNVGAEPKVGAEGLLLKVGAEGLSPNVGAEGLSPKVGAEGLSPNVGVEGWRRRLPTVGAEGWRRRLSPKVVEGWLAPKGRIEQYADSYGMPMSIAIDDRHVYWTISNRGEHTIYEQDNKTGRRRAVVGVEGCRRRLAPKVVAEPNVGAEGLSPNVGAEGWRRRLPKVGAEGWRRRLSPKVVTERWRRRLSLNVGAEPNVGAEGTNRVAR